MGHHPHPGVAHDWHRMPLDDGGALEPVALFETSVEYLPRDRETGETGGFAGYASFRGLLVGRLYLPDSEARDAMDADPAVAGAWVRRLEDQALDEVIGEAEAATLYTGRAA